MVLPVSSELVQDERSSTATINAVVAGLRIPRCPIEIPYAPRRPATRPELGFVRCGDGPVVVAGIGLRDDRQFREPINPGMVGVPKHVDKSEGSFRLEARCERTTDWYIPRHPRQAALGAVAVAAALGLVVANSVFPQLAPGMSNGAYLIGGAIAGAGLLVSILVHEASHAVVAQRHGVEVSSITLWFLGGVAHLEDEAPNPG